MPEKEIGGGRTAPFFLVRSFKVRHCQRFRRFGLYVLGALVFTASSTQAAPFTGLLEVSSSWTPEPGSDRSLGAFTARGFTTTGGAMVCHGARVESRPVQEPTGACGEAEVEAVMTYRIYCQFEGAEDILQGTDTGTSCISLSCYDENFVLQVGCPLTFTSHTTVTGGTGALAGTRGGWTNSGTGTFTQAGRSESGAIFLTATFTYELEGDLELADGSVPPAGAALEIPSPGATVSGISLISGWSCLGGELQVEFSDADGIIETMTVGHGTERPDTGRVCGDIKNGFSAAYNWSRLGSGEKTARLIRNGEEVASHTFFVTAFDVEFVTGASGMCTLNDFPTTGKNATFVWEQSQQDFVLEAVN